MNNNNTYNQPPMGQRMMPPMASMPLRQNRPRGWRERWMNRFGMDMAVPMRKGERTIPNWLTGKSIIFFFVAMLACFAAFGYPMELRDAVIAGVSVVLFFYGGMSLSKSWERKDGKSYFTDNRICRSNAIHYKEGHRTILQIIFVILQTIFMRPNRDN